ncbi:MAG: shikimate dehydrogenase [Desulfobacteraceae bacterium]|nr:shikimate dehydrogenase [Desulfobacteraceae bacterium]
MKNVRSINTSTRICAIIGNPVAHSLSPAIHNAAFAELGLDFVYVAFRVEAAAHALAGMRAMENFRGMSVTIPHKIEAMKHVDAIEDVDRRIGSINTIINDNGKLLGMGTDGPGALKAFIDEGVDIKGKNVLMLGAGGVSRAVAFTLASNGGPAVIEILDINEIILQQLTADLTSSTQVVIKSNKMTDNALAEAMAAADIVIHCTPVGMHPKEGISVVPIALFRPGQVIFDVVYTPLETKLLADAKAKGLQVISGVDMFINQAVLQFERFTGVDAPVEVMRKVVMEHLKA